MWLFDKKDFKQGNLTKSKAITPTTSPGNVRVND
jgi:hypothetical protein